MSATPKSTRRARLGDALAVVSPSFKLDDRTTIAAGSIGVYAPVGYALKHAAIADPREAWEALATAGLIGMDDVECARRVFLCGACPKRSFSERERLRAGGLVECLRCRDGGPTPHPRTVADVVAFASDWANILAAESMARERYGARPVAWRVDPMLRGREYVGIDVEGRWDETHEERALDIAHVLALWSMGVVYAGAPTETINLAIEPL